MDTEAFEALVARWVAGDQLAPADEQRLLDALKNDPAARDALLKDETLDSLLQSWSRLEATGDPFMQACVHRAAAILVSRQPPVSSVGVPPIVAPPVAVPLRTLATAAVPPRPQRPNPLAYSARRWIVAAACCAVLLSAAIGWRWITRGPRPAHQDQVAKSASEGPAPRLEPEGAFATLVHCAGAAWDTPRSEGDRLAAGVLKLTSGTAELRFDKGTVVRLAGPAALDLRSADEALLTSGSISAHVPPPAVGFSVTTPLAWVVDLGTEFDVVVEGSGATQTVVHKGRVSFRPQRGQDELGPPIELTPEAFYRASVSAPNVAAAVVPVTVVAEGDRGRYLGRISARGKTAEFHSPKALDAFRVAALRQLGESPAKFAQNWPGLVDRVAKTEPKAAPQRRGAPAKEDASKPQSAAAVKDPRKIAPPGDAEDQFVEIQEGGKKVSIVDSKDSGITVTITESVGGAKKTTRVNAANPAELEKKNPEAHNLYRKYVRPRPKTGKAK